MIIISSDDLETIRESYIRLSQNSQNLFDNFYNNLFSIDPSIKDLFNNVNIQKQKKMFFESITYFIHTEEITQLDIEEYTNSLKNRHQTIKINSSQINSFREAFIKTLKEVHGSSYNNKIDQIWKILIDSILKGF